MEVTVFNYFIREGERDDFVLFIILIKSRIANAILSF